MPAPKDEMTPLAPTSPDEPPGPLSDVVERAERAHILRTLEFTQGNKRRAIDILQISSNTFYRRLEEFGLLKKNLP